MSSLEVINPYRPNAWQVRYHTSRNRHLALAGGMGSGKSLAAVQEHIQLALEYPGSLWLVGRKTLPSLKDTILRTFLAAIPNDLIADYNKAHLNIKLVNNSEFIFRSLDDEEKLKSLELAGFIVDEANEIDENIYNRLKDRMRQKLPGGASPRFRSTIMLNPGDEDHWIPQLFLFKKPALHEMIQSSTYENLENLPSDYVDELETMYSKDKQQRNIYGQFGKVHLGKAVYPQFANGNYIKEFEYNPALPIVRGWDFGFRRPAVVWAQVERRQIKIIAEMLGKDIYLQDFIKDEVFPYQETLFGLNGRYVDYCDPRGSDQSDKGKTSIDILHEHGVRPIYRRSWINEGIKVVKDQMDMIDKSTGLPNLLVHPRCRNLIEGFKGGYAREDGEEMPRKCGYYEHLQDAARYLCLHVSQRFKVQEHLQSVERVYISPHTGRRLEF